MSFIAYALTALLCFAQVGGCSVEKAPEKVKIEITFELPEPWEVDKADRSALLRQPPRTGDAWFVKIEGGAVKHGDTNDALQYAEQDSKEAGDQLREEIIAGTKVQILTGEAVGEFGGMYSSFYFVRDGWVVWAILYDDYQYYQPAIEQLVRTFHVKELQ
jgi:hypothetical protein